MAFQDLLDPILNPLMQPLLNYSSFWAVFVLALVISVLITLAYKVFTNQDEMKRLKDRQKEFQVKMKGLRNNPEEMMKVQKEAMSVNGEYMKHSFKVMLITMLPIFLIFGWMNFHLGFVPIIPGQEFTVKAGFAEGVTGVALLDVDSGSEIVGEASKEINDEGVSWRVKSDKAGMHTLTVKVGEEAQDKKVLITRETKYLQPIETFKRSTITQIEVKHNELKPLSELLGREYKILGFWEQGGLGLYVIFSLIFSMGLRKLLKVY